MKTHGFRITGGKGFHVSFANGYTVSVQFGYGNYCDERGSDHGGDIRDILEWDRKKGARGDSTAEVAVFDPDGVLLPIGDNDSVIGWQTPEQVAAIITKYAAMEA